MTKEWRKLEILVSQLEAMLVGEGVEVRSPERFYDEDEVQIAEVDVTLRLNAGSSKLLIGLECRLRPSDGPQGVEWINIVNSKKELIGANHMVAVSGTGFTKSAVRAAKRFKVGLRVFQPTDKIELDGWFRTMTFAHAQPFWEQNGNVEVFTSTVPESRAFDLKKALVEVGDEFISLDELINRRVDKIHTPPCSIPDNVRVARVLNLIEVKSFVLDGKRYELDRDIPVSVPVVTWREMQYERMLLNYYNDPENPMILTIVGGCVIQTSNEAFQATIVGTEDISKPNSRKVKWQFFTLDNQILDIKGDLYVIGIDKIQSKKSSS